MTPGPSCAIFRLGSRNRSTERTFMTKLFSGIAVIALAGTALVQAAPRADVAQTKDAIKQDMKNDKRDLKGDQQRLKYLRRDVKLAEKNGNWARARRDRIAIQRLEADMRGDTQDMKADKREEKGAKHIAKKVDPTKYPKDEKIKEKDKEKDKGKIK